MSEPTYINVNIKFAHSLQYGASLSSFKAFESLVLHELVHWGRHQTGIEDGYHRVIGPHPVMKNGDVVLEQVPLKLDSGDRFKFDAYINSAQPHLGYRTEPYVSPKATAA